MPPFTQRDDLYRFVGGIFETAFADPELGARLAATGLVLKLVCTEPDSALIIDTPNKTVRADAGLEPADATMTMSSATANDYWQGKVNLVFAIARGKVKVDGPAGKLLKLTPLSKRLFSVYIERLKADGRDDLIIA
jgi:putative sterol carrier protein